MKLYFNSFGIVSCCYIRLDQWLSNFFEAWNSFRNSNGILKKISVKFKRLKVCLQAFLMLIYHKQKN